jgi:nitrogenase molybdenum-cofactor synthesis protein NifE
MKGLLKILPPLAPDYSGASSVLYTLDGTIMINGADGCIGNVTGYDEPRFFDYNTHIYSSGLREVKAITGDEEILKKKIENSVGDKPVNFIAILGTPNSAVIASDHKGVAGIIHRDRKIPVFTINTTGIDTYEKGAANAYLELARNFVYEVPRLGGVNIIGASPMDYWDTRQLDSIIQSLENRGLKINGVWGSGNSLDSIKNTLAADSNLVISYSGLKAARSLQRKYGIPFVTGVPIGCSESDRIAFELKTVSGISVHAVSGFGKMREKAAERHFGERVVVIGDQIWARSLGNCLKEEHGVSEVYTASFFSLDNSIKTEKDIFIESEKELKRLISELVPDTVFGDPLCKGFLDSDVTRFIEIPHPAVSSRIHWEHEVIYAGDSPSFL